MLDYLELHNLPEMFFKKARELQDRSFLWHKSGGNFQSQTWAQVAAQVRALSKGLRALGIVPGDRVVLVSESRPEWLISDFAIMCCGAITVPAYTTNTVEDHKHILSDSGARAVIVSTPALAEKVLAAAAQLPAGGGGKVFSVLMEGAGGGLPCHSWTEVIRIGQEQQDHISQMIGQLERHDTACIIYTSGTGGVPKGVLQSHGSILHNCRGAYEVLKDLGLGREVFLSFLPLSHSYEHTTGQMFPVSIGAEIYYAEGAEKLASNLIEVRPTIMTAVPRLYEVFYQRIQQSLRKATKTQRFLFDLTLKLGKKSYLTPNEVNPIEFILNKILTLAVRRKVKQRFGGRLKAFVSGGAPLNHDIGVFFVALGVRLLQGYGQTETGPVLSCNLPSNNKIHTVGPPIADTEIKIAEDGEILARGEMAMQGYWNLPEETAKTIQDGWVHTGDIGHLDEDGHIVITDRKKDMIVLSGGDNVSPARIQGILTARPEIGQAAVFGDKQAYVVAIIVPNNDFIKSFAQARGVESNISALMQNKDFHKAIAKAVESVNDNLSVTEKVKRFLITDQPFTIENGLMTPTLKIRRHKIKEIYGKNIEALY